MFLSACSHTPNSGDNPVCEVMGGGFTAIFPDYDRPGSTRCALRINEWNAYYIMSAWSLLNENPIGILNYGINSHENETDIIFAFGLKPEMERSANLPPPTFRNAAVTCSINGDRGCIVTHID
jgi:hypothetical protein